MKTFTSTFYITLYWTILKTPHKGPITIKKWPSYRFWGSKIGQNEHPQEEIMQYSWILSLEGPK